MFASNLFSANVDQRLDIFNMIVNRGVKALLEDAKTKSSDISKPKAKTIIDSEEAAVQYKSLTNNYFK